MLLQACLSRTSSRSDDFDLYNWVTMKTELIEVQVHRVRSSISLQVAPRALIRKAYMPDAWRIQFKPYCKRVLRAGLRTESRIQTVNVDGVAENYCTPRAGDTNTE